MNSALRYRAQQPFLDSLLKEIGMSPGEASNIRNILGDYDDPKKDKHMRFDEQATKTPRKRNRIKHEYRRKILAKKYKELTEKMKP